MFIWPDENEWERSRKAGERGSRGPYTKEDRDTLANTQVGKHFVTDKHICTSFIAFPMQLEKVELISFWYIVAFYKQF